MYTFLHFFLFVLWALQYGTVYPTSTNVLFYAFFFSFFFFCRIVKQSCWRPNTVLVSGIERLWTHLHAKLKKEKMMIHIRNCV